MFRTGYVGRQVVGGGGVNPLFASASLDLNLTSGTLDPRLTFTRAAGPATYYDATGTLQTAGFNSIRNNTGAGAVVGTPGTMPTNWAFANITAPLTPSVVGTGVENGIAFIDLRVSGTLAGGGTVRISFELAAIIAASNGQTWAPSVYLRLVAGSFTNVSVPSLGLIMYDSTPTLLAAFELPIATPTSAPLATQRYSNSITLNNANTASVRPGIVWTPTAGPIDFTIRIGLPQLERGTVATAAIPTSGVASGAPRFDYDPVTHAPRGLLIEEARTNQAINSGSMGTAWVASGATATNAATTAPDNTTTGAFLQEDGGSIGHLLQYPPGSAPLTATIYTLSFFGKAGTRRYINVTGGGLGAVGLLPQWDLAAGTDISVGANAAFTHGIQAIGNGWYRCWFSWTTSNTTVFQLLMGNVPGGGTYQGDGVSGLYLWGGSMEVGAFATSYIPTTAAAATRAADQAQINPLGAWFSAASGTLVAEFDSPRPSSPTVGFSDGTTNNMFYATGSINAAVASVAKNIGALSPAFAFPSGNKIGGVYQSGSIYGAMNGGAVLTNNTIAAGPFAWTTRMALGCSPWGLDTQICGHLSHVRYWNTALTAAQLQSITT